MRVDMGGGGVTLSGKGGSQKRWFTGGSRKRWFTGGSQKGGGFT